MLHSLKRKEKIVSTFNEISWAPRTAREGSHDATPYDTPKTRSRASSLGSSTGIRRIPSRAEKFMGFSSECIPELTNTSDSSTESLSTESHAILDPRIMTRSSMIRGEGLSSSEDSSTPSSDILYNSSQSGGSSPLPLVGSRPRRRTPVHIGETIQEESAFSEASGDPKFTLQMDLPILLFRLEEMSETPSGNGVIIWCKDFRRIILDFRCTEELKKFISLVNELRETQQMKQNLRCFQVTSTTADSNQIQQETEQDQENISPLQRFLHQQRMVLQQQKMQMIQQRRKRRLSASSVDNKNLLGLTRTSSIERCVAFNFREELKRHGQEWSLLKHDDRSLPWRVNLTANYKFQLCKHYPRAIVLPTAISLLSNKKLHNIANHYIGNQLPVVVWSCMRNCTHDHPSCGSVLLRATRRREIAHSDDTHAMVLDALWMSIGHKRKKDKKLRVFDMGLEDFSSSAEQAYTKVIALGLASADEVNDAYVALGSIISLEPEMRRLNAWKAFNKSEYFKICQTYASAAMQVAKTIKKGRPVMIQSPKMMTGHAGDSTTNVLTSLTQLLADPFFRTYEGFLSLIEKEWTMHFTYSFAPPDGISSNAIFVMFLNAVWMCHQLKLEAFEFDVNLLEYVHSELYSTRYHDFLFANRYERWYVSNKKGEDEVSDDEDDADQKKPPEADSTTPSSNSSLTPATSLSLSPIPSPISSLPTTPCESLAPTPATTPPETPHSRSTPGTARSRVTSSRPRGMVGYSLMKALLRKKKKFLNPNFTGRTYESPATPPSSTLTTPTTLVIPTSSTSSTATQSNSAGSSDPLLLLNTSPVAMMTPSDALQSPRLTKRKSTPNLRCGTTGFGSTTPAPASSPLATSVTGRKTRSGSAPFELSLPPRVGRPNPYKPKAFSKAPKPSSKPLGVLKQSPPASPQVSPTGSPATSPFTSPRSSPKSSPRAPAGTTTSAAPSPRGSSSPRRIQLYKQSRTLGRRVGDMTMSKRKESTSFSLSQMNLFYFEEDFALLQSVDKLSLVDLGLSTIPQEICFFRHLTHLTINQQHITTISSSLCELTKLAYLSLKFNKISSIPKEISGLTNLTTLLLDHNQLATLPKWICYLHRLVELSLSGNKISELPSKFHCLSNLEELNLRGNSLEHLPSFWMPLLTNLRNLDLSNNKISDLPAVVGKLVSLTKLNLSRNNLSSLPKSIGNCVNMCTLDASNNQLKKLPKKFGDLTNLQSLFLVENALTALPSRFELTNLKIIQLQSNLFTSLSLSLSSLTSLHQLNLSNNRISFIPHFLFLITSLTDLSLNNNQLTALPATLAFHPQLQKLSVLGNPIVKPELAIVELGLPHIRSDLKLPYRGKELVNRFKLMILGDRGVGKAGLIGHLTKKWTPASAGNLKQSSSTAEPSSNSGKKSNISCQEFEFLTNTSGTDKKVRLQIRTFRAESSYDRTHQFFFSSRAVYLVLFSAIQPHSERSAELWVQKIVARVAKPRIIVCATHIDHGHHIDREETNQRITSLTEKFTNLFRDVVQSIDIIEVSSKTGENMNKLRLLVQMLVSMHKSFGEPVLGSTLLLESAIREHVIQTTSGENAGGPPTMDRKQLVNFAKNCGIQNKEISKNLEYLKDDCQIYFLPPPSSFVVLDSVWLSFTLSSLLTRGHRWAIHGILNDRVVQRIWRNFPNNIHKDLKFVMKKFGEFFRLDPKALENVLSCKTEEEEEVRQEVERARQKISQTVPKHEEKPNTDVDMDTEGLSTASAPESPEGNSLEFSKVVPESGSGIDGYEISNTISSSFSYSSGSSEGEFDSERSSESSDSNEEIYWDYSGGTECGPEAFLVPGLPPETASEVPEIWSSFGGNFDGTREYFRGFHFAYIPMPFFPNFVVSILHLCVPMSIWQTGFLGTCAGLLSVVRMLIDLGKQVCVLVETKTTPTYLKFNITLKGKPGKALKDALTTVLSIFESVAQHWPNLTYGRFAAFPPEYVSWLLDYLQNSPKLKYRDNTLISIESMQKFLAQGVYQVTHPNSRIAVNISEIAPDIVLHEFDIPILKLDEFDKKVGELPSHLLTLQALIGTGGYANLYLTQCSSRHLRGKGNRGDRKEPEREHEKEKETGVPGRPKWMATKELQNSAINSISLPEIWKSFRHEVFIHQQLKHPSFPALYGLSLNPMTLMMEYMPYGDLFTVLHKSKSYVDWHLTTQIAIDIAEGLKYMHSLTPPIVHRDLKSPNILLRSFNPQAPPTIKIIDFGCSTTTDMLLNIRVVENPIWLAPEILKGLPYGLSVDVYAFAMVLWEMISRQEPFYDIKWMSDIENAIIRGVRPEIPAHCPPEFKEIISHCWAQNPAMRPEWPETLEKLQAIREKSADLEREFGIQLKKVVEALWAAKEEKEKKARELEEAKEAQKTLAKEQEKLRALEIHKVLSSPTFLNVLPMELHGSLNMYLEVMKIKTDPGYQSIFKALETERREENKKWVKEAIIDIEKDHEESGGDTKEKDPEASANEEGEDEERQLQRLLAPHVPGQLLESESEIREDSSTSEQRYRSETMKKLKRDVLSVAANFFGITATTTSLPAFPLSPSPTTTSSIALTTSNPTLTTPQTPTQPTTVEKEPIAEVYYASDYNPKRDPKEDQNIERAEEQDKERPVALNIEHSGAPKTISLGHGKKNRVEAHKNVISANIHAGHFHVNMFDDLLKDLVEVLHFWSFEYLDRNEVLLRRFVDYMYQHNLDVEGLFLYTKSTFCLPHPKKTASISTSKSTSGSATQSDSSSSFFERDVPAAVYHGPLIASDLLAKMDGRLQAKEITDQMYSKSLFDELRLGLERHFDQFARTTTAPLASLETHHFDAEAVPTTRKRSQEDIRKRKSSFRVKVVKTQETEREKDRKEKEKREKPFNMRGKRDKEDNAGKVKRAISWASSRARKEEK